MTIFSPRNGPHPADERTRLSKQAGFSLIFMSIFITAAAIVMVSFLPEAGNDNAKTISDVEKLQTVEEHMRSFMAYNRRRPCPADGQYPVLGPNTRYFGQEAGTPGTCQGNTAPTPNAPLGPDAATGNIVAGVIPTRSLGLDSSYAFDSYGHRFTYVVDKRATSTATCLNLEYENGTTIIRSGKGGLYIDDAAGNQIDQVMYAYIQHGPSGYGAWPGDGSATTLTTAQSIARRVNSGSTDLAMQIDAGVAPGANPGASTFAPDEPDTLVRNSMTLPMTTGGKLDTGFNDILWYRDDLKNTCSFCSFRVKDMLVLGVDSSSSSQNPILLFPWVCSSLSQWTNQTALNDINSGSTFGAAAMSYDDQYLFGIGADGGTCALFKLNGVEATDITSGNITCPSSVGWYTQTQFTSASANASGYSYLAVLNPSTLYIYKKGSGDSFTSLATLNSSSSPVFTPCNANYAGMMSFSLNGQYLAVLPQSNSPTCTGTFQMFQNSSDTFSSVNLTTAGLLPLPDSSTVTGVAFSPDVKYLAVGTAANDLYVYTITAGPTFTLVDSLPGSFTSYYWNFNHSLQGVPAIAFSPDDYFLVGYWKGWGIIVFTNTSGNTYAPTSSLPAGWTGGEGYDLADTFGTLGAFAFSNDNKYFALGDYSNTVYIFSRSGNTLTYQPKQTITLSNIFGHSGIVTMQWRP